MEDRYITNPAVDLGTIDYVDSLMLQRKLVERVRRREIGDVLLFLDHPPVFTVGRGKKPENYRGVEVVETERGGDVTYHGPGQLVIYPIIDLERNGMYDVRKFVKLLENIVIASISKFGYSGSIGDEPGIWVEGKKVSSIGLAIKNKISFHGISINISKEVLSGFSRINPCGLDSGTIGFVDVERVEMKREVKKNFEIALHPFEEAGRDFLLSLPDP
jgi:lipoyl(octanoyl) transferase